MRYPARSSNSDPSALRVGASQLSETGPATFTSTISSTVPELPEGRGKLRIREPFGVEVLVAVGMPVPFNDDEAFNFDEGDFFKTFKRDELRALLGRGTRKVVFEDDKGKTRPAPVSHASVAFTTEE